MLGFHFKPRWHGRLKELEFFRDPSWTLAASYPDFQGHFEDVFGRPTRSQNGSEGFPSYWWELPEATIYHQVTMRFGPEEHMRIRRS